MYKTFLRAVFYIVPLLMQTNGKDMKNSTLIVHLWWLLTWYPLRRHAWLSWDV